MIKEKNTAVPEERVIGALRSMYAKRGYLPFRMSKFEEYELYMKNRDFLLGENIISFTDTDGALLALKPDVTLSIIKNAKDAAGVKEKVYYNEHVYRTSGSTHKFKEIMQMGLECIGDLDDYDVCEAIELATESLNEISADFVLDISHVGFVSALLDAAGLSEAGRGELITCISNKNSHETAALLTKYGVSSEEREKILSLLSVRVPLSLAEKTLAPLAVGERGRAALSEISVLAGLLADSPLADKIYFDTSVMNDMKYYNGIVFRGFVSGVSEGVLSGGRYDALMARMGKDSKALGFAIYLDLLEGFFEADDERDVDVLLVYGEKVDTGRVYRRVKELVADGYSVTAQKAVPDGLRYGRLERMEE